MIDWLLQHEASLRLSVFVGLFVLLALAQWWRPRRQTQGQTPRRLTNLALVIIDTLLLRLVLPLLAFDLALQMQRNDVGLLNSLPPLAGIVVGMLALDMMIYWQHRLMHVVPWLWRLHRMHHADTEFDVTTAVRFHPFEIVLSMVIKLGAIAALGVPAVAVLLFEVILNAASLFNHTNLRLSPGVERVLRWFIVTPDMHRIPPSAPPRGRPTTPCWWVCMSFGARRINRCWRCCSIRSGRRRQMFAQRRPIAPADRHRRLAGQTRLTIAAVKYFNLFHAIQIHNRLTMHAGKAL